MLSRGEQGLAQHSNAQQCLAGTSTALQRIAERISAYQSIEQLSMGLVIILRLGRVSSLTQTGDGFSYSLIDEHQRIAHREDRVDEDAVGD